MITGILIVVAIWIVCGVIAFGAMLADAHKNFPEEEYWVAHRSLSLGISLLGPFALVRALFQTGVFAHGLMYRRPVEQTMYEM